MKPQLKLADCVGKTLTGLVDADDYSGSMLLLFDDGFATVNADGDSTGWLLINRRFNRESFDGDALLSAGIYTADEIAAFKAEKRAQQEAFERAREVARLDAARKAISELKGEEREAFLAELTRDK